MKGGFDVRRTVREELLLPDDPRPAALLDASDAFVNDVAEAANINKPLPGGEEVNYYRWWDQYYFVAGRVAGQADADAQPRPALRAAMATTFRA